MAHVGVMIAVLVLKQIKQTQVVNWAFQALFQTMNKFVNLVLLAQYLLFLVLHNVTHVVVEEKQMQHAQVVSFVLLANSQLQKEIVKGVQLDKLQSFKVVANATLVLQEVKHQLTTHHALFAQTTLSVQTMEFARNVQQAAFLEKEQLNVIIANVDFILTQQLNNVHNAHLDFTATQQLNIHANNVQLEHIHISMEHVNVSHASQESK